MITRWIVSITISLLLCLVHYYVSLKKDKKNSITKKQKKHMSQVLSTLIYMPDTMVMNFFYKLVKTKHNCVCNKNYITIINDDKNVVLFPKINNQKLSLSDFAEIIKQVFSSNIKRLIVLCNDYDNKINLELQKFDFEIIFLKNDEIYLKLLKKYEFYPQILIKEKQKTKKTILYLLNSCLNKKRTKGYFLTSICIFIASFFNPYKIYYVLVSSFLIILAIFSWFNIKFNSSKEINLFE